MLFFCLQPADVKAPQFLEVERSLPFGNSLVPQRTMLSHGPLNHVKRWKWILRRFLLILNSGVSNDLDKCLFDYDWYDWIPGYWSSVYSIKSRVQCFDSRHAMSLSSRGLGSWPWLAFPSELTLWGDTRQFCIMYNQSEYMCCFQLWTYHLQRFCLYNRIVFYFPLKFISVRSIYGQTSLWSLFMCWCYCD